MWIINNAARYSAEVKNLLSSAKKEIIVTGGTLSDLNTHRITIDEITSKGVKIKLLALDVENREILDGYNKLIERPGKADNLHHLQRFENNKNIEIRKFNLLPLVYFIAKDIDDSNGAIMAVHLLSNGEIFPCITATEKKGEWYELYKSQIKSIWEKGVPYKSS
jgi:sugar-specific transcriptional regulator TrmB